MHPLIITAGPGWVAANKPAGISIHNDPGRDLLSLLAARLIQDHDLASTCTWESSFAPSAVHRLDRETSGVVLLATSAAAARVLSEQFAERTVEKVYRAILAGKSLADQGEWNFPLTESAGGRLDPAGPKVSRKDCRTLFKKVRGNEFFCETELLPRTGRQHQLRRHAALAGHQVVGDRRYGNPKYADKVAKIYGRDRLFLHAESLTFAPPDGGGSVTVCADLPAEFLHLMEPK